MDFRRAVVRSVEERTPNMIRVEFEGDELADLPWTGVPDERIRVALPEDARGSAPAPQLVAGEWDYPAEARPPTRSYTVRRWEPDRGITTVDFVRHSGGVAASWAMQATPGQHVYLHLGGTWYEPAADAAWQLLIADMPGLPALGRALEQLPEGTRAHVIAEVIEPGDVQHVDTAASVTFEWYSRTGHELGESVLPGAVAGFEQPPGLGYVWAATETSVSRQIRQLARRTWALAPDHFDIIGYWRPRNEEWLRRYRNVEAEVFAVVDAARASGLTGQDLIDIQDAALERVGL